MARVLILGAGFGGISAAVTLRRLAPGVEVVLVDRRADFAMGLRKTWEVVGEAPLAEGTRLLSGLAKRGVVVRQGHVEGLDPANIRATVDGETIAADAMVVALGAEHAPEAIPGLVEHGINVWDREGASRARAALERFAGGRLSIGVFGTPYSCPPGPFELAILASERLGRRGVKVEVEVFGPMPIALPVAGPVESGRLEALLRDAAIAFLPKHQAVEVDAGSVRFVDAAERPFDLLLAVPPHRCPAILVEAGLAPAGGWVAVDPRTLATAYERVYAIGDCTAIPLAHGLPLPKAGVFAEAEGEVVAERVAAELTGRQPTGVFAGEGVCYVEVGGDMAAAVRGSFLADPPGVEFIAATTGQRADKLAFERERLERWFGR
ncbi:MAG TPA: FAD-dependent oxidoreductase [Candidatus Limnocylindrales bacterium]|nr:FAD-dependent oxidoreductase [Candidatus Limnocylindrales bacterium]